MKKQQITAVGFILTVAFGAGAAAFHWGLADVPAIKALDDIDIGMEPGPTVQAVRDRLAVLEAVPASDFLVPVGMHELRTGLAELEQAWREIGEADRPAVKKSKRRDFTTKRISVTVDLKMTAEDMGFIRGLYRLVFLILFAAGVAAAIGWPGIGAIICLHAALISAIGLFLDTHLGYSVFALGFILLAVLFGMSMSRLPANHRLVAHMEHRLSQKDQAGQRRIFRREILVGLMALVFGAVLSVVVSLAVPYVAVGFVGLMAYGVLKFGISFGVWLRHRFAR